MRAPIAEGREKLGAWGRWLDAWEEFSLELVDVIEAGEEIVALQRLRGAEKESGVTVDADAGRRSLDDRTGLTRIS